jgi:hypothetical protein
MTVTHRVGGRLVSAGGSRVLRHGGGSWLRLGGSGKRIRTLTTATAISAATGAITVTATTLSTARCLRTMLFNQGLELTVLKHLAQTSNSKAEH